MIHYILFYFLGFLITANILSTWFSTTIVEKIFSLFIRGKTKTLTYQDIIDIIDEKNNFIAHFFAELLSCPLCLGHWISCAVAVVIILSANLHWAFLPACMFSWPRFAYMFLGHKD